jgi:mevalonate kinase
MGLCRFVDPLSVQMKAVTATAPGKIILFGEHAVVYGQPALAVPVWDVYAQATVQPGPPGRGVLIEAADLHLQLSLAEESAHGLVLTVKLVLEQLKVPEPDVLITASSTIPIAGGMGSGAAISAALARALGMYLEKPFNESELSALVYEVEKFYHGTPSGIDNTVICYGQPVYFVRGQPPVTFQVYSPFHLLIADTGIASPTKQTVSAVRERRDSAPEIYDLIFANIGQIAREARQVIERGEIGRLGRLMTRNHALLCELGVSSPELERLIEAALNAGAEGAKLSGGGGGGNMIALAMPDRVQPIYSALEKAGAARVIHTVVR